MNEKEGLKNDELQLLRTGMSDNVNLLNEDELGEIFGGYCASGYECCDPNSYTKCNGYY